MHSEWSAKQRRWDRVPRVGFFLALMPVMSVRYDFIKYTYTLYVHV
jgi:hypothetical protein